MLRTLCILVLAVAAISGRGPPFYRRDFHYVERYDAFYKLHEDQTLSWNTALLTCKDEGATLFFPKIAAEWNVVKDLTAVRKTKQDIPLIYVGIHNQLGLGEYITINGQPTPLPLLNRSSEVALPNNDCVLMDTAKGSFHLDSCENNESLRPFICKKEIDHTPCPTIDAGYKFAKETNKCYKFNNLAKTWQKAMQTCFMEGGSLAIVKDSEEASILQRLHTQTPDQESTYYVGFRKLYNDFFTAKGGSLVDSFYHSYNMNEWNADSGCGIMWFQDRNRLFDTTPCSKLLPFVCEINALSVNKISN